MKRHQNTLYVTTQSTYLAKDGETVRVRSEGKTLLRVPIHNLGSIVCFGNVSASPFLLGLCAWNQVSVSFLSETGRFLAKVVGPVSGNVLLRREQYRRSDDLEASAELAKAMIAAKVYNSRRTLARAAAAADKNQVKSTLNEAMAELQKILYSLGPEGNLDSLRGLEGLAARNYFGAFDAMIRRPGQGFHFSGRNRRPPTDPVNALLSFLYTLLRHDMESALECVGLDPAVGFLHRDRPGRPGLALDLMEEFRAFLVDRLVLSLINRKQIKSKGFSTGETGACTMDETTRKTVIKAYQKRKLEEIEHPFLGEKTTIGLLFHLQTTLLARHLRGDLDAYPPFTFR